MGRKPLAAEVHIRNGSYAKNPKRQNKQAPKVNHALPLMPEMFETLEHATAKWNQLTEQLSTLGVLAETDGDLLEQYCVSYQLFRDAFVKVQETGLALDESTQHGTTTKRNPYCGELHKHMDRLSKLMAEMGLTPSSRTKLIATPPGEEDDGLLNLLKRGGLN